MVAISLHRGTVAVLTLEPGVFLFLFYVCVPGRHRFPTTERRSRQRVFSNERHRQPFQSSREGDGSL